MSLHPTSRDAATGGRDPFSIADSMDFNALQQGVEIIDNDVGPGWTTVRKTPGKINPNEKLHDAISYGPLQPGVTISVRHTS